MSTRLEFSFLASFLLLDSDRLEAAVDLGAFWEPFQEAYPAGKWLLGFKSRI